MSVYRLRLVDIRQCSWFIILAVTVVYGIAFIIKPP